LLLGRGETQIEYASESPHTRRHREHPSPEVVVVAFIEKVVVV
jgi:hypothetical protein